MYDNGYMMAICYNWERDDSYIAIIIDGTNYQWHPIDGYVICNKL